MKYVVAKEKETSELASKFSKSIYLPLIVGITGPLGAGKTSFVRHFIKKYRESEKVKSPTFGLLEEYNYAEIKIIHVDLYRIKKYEKNYIDFYNYHTEKSLFLIEWIDNDQKLMQNSDIIINIKILDENGSREFNLMGNSSRGKRVIENMKNDSI